jgi:hypothetical protein
MTVGELIRELQKYDEKLPVAIDGDIYFPPQTQITVSVKTWEDSNYPYDLPDFDYLNLE